MTRSLSSPVFRAPALLPTLIRCASVAALIFPLTAALIAQDKSVSHIGPVTLQTDALSEPLGIDNPHPELSWQIRDPRHGARQAAYDVMIFSKHPVSLTEKPDVWDSGRVESATSNGVPYAGPELQPSKRYFWRITAWDQNGKPYAVSEVSWFETGLLQQANWHAEWIGHESSELHAVRTSGATWITKLRLVSLSARRCGTY